MRILLINPNTSPAVTAIVADHVRRIAGPSVTVDAVTARFGARYIADRASLAVAAHAALECLARSVAGCDAVYLACFGDPGLGALRDLCAVPVTGMAEASCRAAAGRGRFAIVTGGAAWAPILTELIGVLGFAECFAGVRTVAATGAELVRDPERGAADLAAACRACAAEGAEAVLLGGAALAGWTARIQPHVPVPVLCSVEASVAAMLDPAARRLPRAAVRSETVGLAAPLARLMADA